MNRKRFLGGTSLAALAIALLGAPVHAQTTIPDQASATATSQLEELIVTAQKRSERLIDVPTAISAISGERLETLHVASLTDLSRFVPGLSVVSNGTPGARTVTLRGISTGASQTTAALAATYIDDMPAGSSGNAVRGSIYGVDLSPDDLQGIEVLKGPQGTLYGANAMGGLIKYTLRKPNLHKSEGSVSATLDSIANSREPSWGVHAAGGAPLIDGKLAVRLSGFYKDNAGYLDNVGLGEKGANTSKQYGGIASALWKPTNSLTIQATALAQNIRAANYSTVVLDPISLKPIYGRYANTGFVDEPFNQNVRNFGLVAEWDVGFATITESTSYSTVSSTVAIDLSAAFGGFCGTPGACPDYPKADAHALFVLEPEQVKKFTQEVRLASPTGGKLQWLVGAYFTDEKGEEGQSFPTFTASNQPLPDRNNLFKQISNSDYKEKAAFANITYQVVEQFDVSAGLRYSSYTQDIRKTAITGFLGSGSVPVSTSLPSQGVTLWMVNARYHLNSNAMIYGRVATGYRPGSGCPTCGTPSLGLPGIVGPDKTTNYELGLKGDFFDRKLKFDVAAFRIDWEDVQITALTPAGLRYATNGGAARSQGVELTTSYLLLDGLEAGATLAYTDAKTLDDIPASSAKAGDMLPYTARWSGTVRLDYSRPVFDGSSTFTAGGNYHYRTNENNGFASAAPPFAFGRVSALDLYAGLSRGGVTYNLYATNITNDRSYVGLQNSAPAKYVPLQPRTFGLSVRKDF